MHNSQFTVGLGNGEQVTGNRFIVHSAQGTVHSWSYGIGILKDLVTENLLIRGFRETDGEDLYDIYLMKMVI